MSAVQNLPQTDKMPYALRPMRERDIEQASEVEKDAFPTLFPPTSFRRELKNRLARYLIAWRLEYPPDLVAQFERQAKSNRSRGLWHRATASIRRGRPIAWQPGQQYIVGFLGVWYMPDDAHIVSVGVRNDYRGLGIGELLLIGAIEQAQQCRRHVVTLEVRVSNHIAQNLYKKYGFETTGVRKGYYSDNREDALIMTVSSIHTLDYRQRLRLLTAEHRKRWGSADRTLS